MTILELKSQWQYELTSIRPIRPSSALKANNITHPQFPAPHADIALLDNVIEVGGHLWGTWELLEWIKACIQPFGFPLQPVQPTPSFLRSLLRLSSSLPWSRLLCNFCGTSRPEDHVDLQTRFTNRIQSPQSCMITERREKGTHFIYLQE